MRFFCGKFLMVVYLVTLVVLILMPARGLSLRGLEVEPFAGDFVAHCLAFLPWVPCAYLIWGGRLWVWLCLILGVMTVLGLEFLHLYIPQRGFEWLDMVAGLVGLVCSFVLYMGLRLVRPCFARWF